MAGALQQLSNEAGNLDTPGGRFRDLFFRLSGRSVREISQVRAARRARALPRRGARVVAPRRTGPLRAGDRPAHGGPAPRSGVAVHGRGGGGDARRAEGAADMRATCKTLRLPRGSVTARRCWREGAPARGPRIRGRGGACDRARRSARRARLPSTRVLRMGARGPARRSAARRARGPRRGTRHGRRDPRNIDAAVPRRGALAHHLGCATPRAASSPRARARRASIGQSSWGRSSRMLRRRT